MYLCSSLAKEKFSDCWLLLWDLGCSAYIPGGLCPSFAVGRAARLFLLNYNCCDCCGPNSVLALDHLSQPNPWTKESSTSWGENMERGEPPLRTWQGLLGCDAHSLEGMIYPKNDAAKSFPSKGEVIQTTAYSQP